MSAIRSQTRVLVGHCGVDSGQILLADPCYINSFKDGETFAPAEAVDGQYPFSYNGACGATLSDKSAGQLGNATGVAVSSGWGDGVYPVYADYDHDGKITSVTIVFLDDDDDDNYSEFDSEEQ